MINIFLVLTLCLWSFSSHAFSLYCFGGISEDGNSQVNVHVSPGSEAVALTSYKNYPETKLISLAFNSEGNYSSSMGECSDQNNGGHDYSFVIQGNVATYTYSWCDDDGFYGTESYKLKCVEL